MMLLLSPLLSIGDRHEASRASPLVRMGGQGRGRTADLPLFRCSGCTGSSGTTSVIGRTGLLVGGCRQPLLPSSLPSPGRALPRDGSFAFE